MNEVVPSLRMYRPVLNIKEKTLTDLYAVAARNDIRVPNIIYMDLDSTIVGPGELIASFRQAQRRITPEVSAALGAHIFESLSVDTPEGIQVPTFPMGRYNGKGHKSRPVVTIGAENQEVLGERATLCSVIGEFPEVPGLSFLNRDVYTQTQLGAFKNDPEHQAADAFEDFLLRHPDLLPPQIEYGNLHIGDKPYR